LVITSCASKTDVLDAVAESENSSIAFARHGSRLWHGRSAEIIAPESHTFLRWPNRKHRPHASAPNSALHRA
jgi:hypothetical protein